MGGAGRSSVRVLSIGATDVGGSTAGQEPSSKRCSDRWGDERQYLPMRDIREDSSSHSSCRIANGRASRGWKSEETMNRPLRLSRRGFLRVAASGAAGLVVGFY